jgi:mRNA-degrading endonuclease RelE of RelBE toxin-antitoxin system
MPAATSCEASTRSAHCAGERGGGLRARPHAAGSARPHRSPRGAVAAAVSDFLGTAIVREPRRVGKPLEGELGGVWSARRGTYRIHYRVLEEQREVVVLRIEHRRDVYRPR